MFYSKMNTPVYLRVGKLLDQAFGRQIMLLVKMLAIFNRKYTLNTYGKPVNPPENVLPPYPPLQDVYNRRGGTFYEADNSQP